MYVLPAIALLALLGTPESGLAGKNSPYKVYVMLGFHTSFYHSWRGDSNDEAGFGTDIRVVRGILEQLDKANAMGLDARGYWDIDDYFTLQEIIMANAPDIIDGIKARVDAGLDEVLPAPYNNGMTSAHTPEELEILFKYALRNPQGTGLEQVFGKVTPIFRPQEAMTTPGIIPFMEDAGIKGIILPYSAFPFTSFSNFVHPLPPEQRYGVTWLKHDTGPERTILLSCISPPDALNFGSPELLMRYLRKLQTSGKVKSDLVMHYNFDADAESWLPLDLPFGLSGLPNSGGVMEFVNAVNKYDWAEFATPGEYLESHKPVGEVIVRQDTADGAFDGYYSWAEKYESHVTWTAVEQSRMYKNRALKQLKSASSVIPDKISVKIPPMLRSAVRNAVLAQSTTHFGMSTPIINEERQAKADMISRQARDEAFEAYKTVSSALKMGKAGGNGKGGDYLFHIYRYAGPSMKETPSRMAVRIPLILGEPGKPVLRDGGGARIRASLINVEKLIDGSYAAELTFIADMRDKASESYSLEIIKSPRSVGIDTLKPGGNVALFNDAVRLELSPDGASIPANGDSCRFLDPFISYRTKKKPVRYGVSEYAVQILDNEYLDRLQRAKLKARIPFETPEGEYAVNAEYAFSIYDDLPYIIVDVDVDYPYTPPREIISTIQQKLRRLLDLRWREVAPFQVHTCFTAPEETPFTVWKHNYLGVVSSYDMDYGQINPKNREIDSFNHQVTNGWVAVTNGAEGLLIAQDASVNALFAFAPMRLRVKKGGQYLSINPFGTYFGKQLDYSHLHKNDVGTKMTVAMGAHLRPSGPSFNGKRERFRLLLAPYKGDNPPEEMRNDAMAFFYPYGLWFDKTPMGDGIVLPEDVASRIKDLKLKELAAKGGPLPPPTAVLANPSDGAVDLVWDIPRDERITNFHVAWRLKGAPHEEPLGIKKLGRARRIHIDGLENGKTYIFQVTPSSEIACGDDNGDGSTVTVEGVPGPVVEVDMGGAAKAVPVGVVLKLAKGIVKHMILIH